MKTTTKWEALVGQRFGMIVVTALAETGRNREARVVTICDCGAETIARARAIAAGLKRSCGCLIRVAATKHGMYRSRTYKSWLSMIARCSDPNAKNYGALGVTVCTRWRSSFENFLADMGERPAGKTLDRFPNRSGNYEPSNCRWATVREQNLNRKSTLLSLDDVAEVARLARSGVANKDIAARFGVSRNVIANVLFRERRRSS